MMKTRRSVVNASRLRKMERHWEPYSALQWVQFLKFQKKIAMSLNTNSNEYGRFANDKNGIQEGSVQLPGGAHRL